MYMDPFDMSRTMNERTIMDRAGDLWMVEAGAPRPDGTRRVRCRHELGYELTLTLDAVRDPEDAALLDALEQARRREPRQELAEAA